MVFSTHSLSADYPKLIDQLVINGQSVDTRGGRTREIIDFSLELGDPARCLVDRDGVSRRFMDAEIAMLLAGIYDDELIRAITPKAADLTTPYTAYGPRVRHQLPRIVEELRTDPNSRRAVVYVGDSDDLETIGPDTAGEMPCTMTWQFLCREDMLSDWEHPRRQLHMIVNMRSWDAVWGLTYDVPCFVAVQMAVAKALRADLGEYRHHAGSFHIYERHWNIDTRENDETLEIEWLGDSWSQTVANAETVRDLLRTGAHRG